MTLVSDLLAIEDPASIASSTVVSYTCGICHSRTTGCLTWIHKTVHWMRTIRTDSCKIEHYSVKEPATALIVFLPVAKLFTDGAAKIQCRKTTRREIVVFIIAMQ